MAQPPNARIIRERYEKAKALAKKGQFQKARYMLQDIQSHPPAQKLLKQIDNRNDKTQFGLGQFFNGTLLIMGALIIIVIFVFYTTVTNIQSGVSERDAVAIQFSARALQGNRDLFVDLVYFCYDQVGDNRESCLDWGQTVFSEYQDNVRRCVIVADGVGIQYRNQELSAVAECYRTAGIPDPS